MEECPCRITECIDIRRTVRWRYYFIPTISILRTQPRLVRRSRHESNRPAPSVDNDATAVAVVPAAVVEDEALRFLGSLAQSAKEVQDRHLQHTRCK